MTTEGGVGYGMAGGRCQGVGWDDMIWDDIQGALRG